MDALEEQIKALTDRMNTRDERTFIDLERLENAQVSHERSLTSLRGEVHDMKKNQWGMAEDIKEIKEALLNLTRAQRPTLNPENQHSNIALSEVFLQTRTHIQITPNPLPAIRNLTLPNPDIEGSILGSHPVMGTQEEGFNTRVPYLNKLLPNTSFQWGRSLGLDQQVCQIFSDI